jgi:hypothetical protein
MAKRGGLLTAVVTALALAATSSPAPADSLAPPRSYKDVTPGGKYVFVMISPRTVEADAGSWNEETAADIREIRRTYTRSGMYRNDGSTEPLWTVDWYAYGVELTADGAHLIRPGPWAGLRDDKTPDLGYTAVNFYARGELIRAYRIGELVDDPSRLFCSVSHFSWRKDGWVSGEFEYTITTLDGNRFVFDVRTGEIVSESRSGRLSRPGGVLRWGWVALGVAAVAVAAVAVASWLSRRRRSRQRAVTEQSVAPDGTGHDGNS